MWPLGTLLGSEGALLLRQRKGVGSRPMSPRHPTCEHTAIQSVAGFRGALVIAFRPGT